MPQSDRHLFARMTGCTCGSKIDVDMSGIYMYSLTAFGKLVFLFRLPLLPKTQASDTNYFSRSGRVFHRNSVHSIAAIQTHTAGVEANQFHHMACRHLNTFTLSHL